MLRIRSCWIFALAFVLGSLPPPATASTLASFSTACNGPPTTQQQSGPVSSNVSTLVSFGPGNTNLGRAQFGSRGITQTLSAPTLSSLATVQVTSPTGSSCSMGGFSGVRQLYATQPTDPDDARDVPYQLEIRLDGALEASKADGVGATALVQASLLDPDESPLRDLGEILIDAATGVSSLSGFDVSPGLVQDVSTGEEFLRLVDGSLFVQFLAPARTQFRARVSLTLGAFDLGGAGMITATARFLDGLRFEVVSLDPEVAIVPIPEPATGLLVTAGLLGTIAWRRRRERIHSRR